MLFAHEHFISMVKKQIKKKIQKRPERHRIMHQLPKHNSLIGLNKIELELF